CFPRGRAVYRNAGMCLAVPGKARGLTRQRFATSARTLRELFLSNILPRTSQYLHAGHETIAHLGYCSDERLAVGAVAQQFPQYGNVMRQSVFAHIGARPKPLHEFIFFDQAAVIFHQEEQCLKDLRGERQAFAVAEEQALASIQTKLTKLV